MRVIKTDAKLIDSVKGNPFIYKKRIPEHLHLYLMKNYRKESSCITGFENVYLEKYILLFSWC